MATLPVTVIGGYLGAGKTTLVNHLLREARGLRLAVLVNEFGELPIDADLIESRGENVINIAGGCVCCSYGSDLMGALLDLRDLRPAPQHLLVEASGVAIPHAIAQSVTLVDGYAIDGVVVLADAETVRERATDTYLSDTVLRQLGDAQIVILNKTDLVTPAQRDVVRGWVARHAPGASIVDAVAARVPLAAVLGRAMDRLAPPGHADLPGHGHDHHSEHHARVFHIDHPVDARALARGLSETTLDLVRAKGFVTEADGRLRSVQIVGRRWCVTDAPPDIDARGRIVCIRFRADVDTGAVGRLIDRARTA